MKKRLDAKTRQQTLDKIQEFNTNGKKTICFFCDVFYPSIDGVISVVNNLAISLSDTFNIVVCVPKHKGNTFWKDEYLVLGANSVSVPFMDYECSTRPQSDKEFVELLGLLKIDAVHIHSPFFMGKFAVRFAKRNNIPICATIHSQYKIDFWMSTKSHLLTQIMLKSVMRVFNSTELIFTLNEWCRKVFLEYGAKPKIKIISNATNFDANANEAIVAQTNKTYDLEHKEFVGLYVGRLVKVKNLTTTLKVLAELKKHGTDFKFVFVGEGSQLKKLQKQAKKLNIANQVVFAGKIVDKEVLSALYKRADLFVFTSKYDTEGIVVREAAAKGTPSMVIENTGAASNITNNKNGFVVEDDVQKMANKIIELLDDKTKLNVVGKSAQNSLVKKWSDVAKEHCKAYEELINKKR